MNMLDRITKACESPNGDYAISACTDLTTVGGNNYNKVMPPIYAAKKDSDEKAYHVEDRYEDGKPIRVVVLDSYASCANRLEEAAYEAWKQGEFPMPMVSFSVQISEGHKETYSALNLPHRIFSAQFKSTYTPEKQKFLDSRFGIRGIYNPDHKRVMKTVLQMNPFSILLGSWRSHVIDVSVNRARAYRQARSLIMEIIGGNPLPTKKTSGMLVPIEIPIQDGVKKPSEIGLGSIVPSLSPGGFSVSWIKEFVTFAIHGLYDYCTGNPEHDVPARAMLVCMGLYAHVLRSRNYSLRSNCHLTKKAPTIYRWNDNENDTFTIDIPTAKQMYMESVSRIPGYDVNFNLELQADEDLTAKCRSGYMDGSEKEKKKAAAASKRRGE